MILRNPRRANKQFFMAKQAIKNSNEQSALALKNVFFLLGLIFQYPDETVYDEIRQKLEAFDGFFSEYGEGIPPLPRVSDLQAEYVSLFVNNKGFVPALPYASFHMDQGQLMGRTYFKIKDVLEESGFRLDASALELEDHLSILLETCSGLVNELIEKKFNPSKSQTAVSALLEITSCMEHWVDDFAEQVASHASMGFYRISSEALKNFIHDVNNIYKQVLGLNDEKNEPQG
jgi:TorA maturation chaperone TorD